VSYRSQDARPIQFGGPVAPGVKAIFWATVAVWVFQILSGLLAGAQLERLFGLVPYDVTRHLFLWQLVTYIFLHSMSVFHILFNMLALWMLGSELEWLWGTKRFVRFYFITGAGAAICSTLVAPGSTIPIIGASGAIYGLLAAYGILFPDREFLFWFLFPIKAKYLVLILGALAFWMSVSAPGDGVAHVAHLGGMLFGWLYLRGPRGLTKIRLPFREWMDRWRRERLKRKFKVYYKETRGKDDSED
jgi:membrane associated rhomboid family serine protease